ncbi:DUF3995 domain-containing protein [Nesterenkonia sp. HG001]|uniref:DUF3995 domain-containing protein n=1 Tax=Nesterenkonia sp. HG001 TaxID=2983207 RepID=UPI002AC61C46|nr:DUF3995 domain-containing protein [Nesterenkonia sp. HG001]MDZ5078328.1 DUF3995 domain-containing protein [Nesterenkonia sp. HG001]
MPDPHTDGDSAATSPRRHAPTSRRTIRLAFLVAAVLGTLHAIPSFYWALGGEQLLPLVGQWAVDAVRQGDTSWTLLLLATGVLKLAAAWVPMLAEEGRLPWPTLWRATSWVGAVGLILYGGADIVAGGLVLMGVLDVEVTDRTGLLGHTLLWGPHFMLWGLALLGALVLSRRRPVASSR